MNDRLGTTHEWGNFNCCLRCGQTWEAVLDNLASPTCAATPNVVAISHILQRNWYNENVAPVTGRYCV